MDKLISSIFSKGPLILLVIAIIALGVQTYRVKSLQADITELNSQITTLKDNEVKYQAALEEQKQKMEDLKDLVARNEKSFQDYVKAQNQKNTIIANATIVKKGQENTGGIIDANTSRQIKEFYNARYKALQEKLNSGT